MLAKVVLLFFQLVLLVLEGTGGFHGLLVDTQEHGNGVVWQFTLQVGAQPLEVEFTVVAGQTNLCHAGPAIGVGNFHTVNHRFLNAIKTVQNLFHFGGGHVFAFPAEGIAQTIHELRMAEADIAHHVAGVEPGVALLENVTEDGFFGLLRVGVAVKWGLVGDLAEHQAGFALTHLDHVTAAVAYRLVPFLVVFDDGIADRRETHGVVEVEHIGKSYIAF